MYFKNFIYLSKTNTHTHTHKESKPTHDHTYHKITFYLHLLDHDIVHMFYSQYTARHKIEYMEPYLMLILYMMDEL